MLHGSTAPHLKNPTIIPLLDEIRERRDEFEKLTYVPPDIVRKLQSAGIYRAFVPRELGGDELSPGEFLETIELLSTADASTGWVASFGVSTIYLAALPPDVFNEIYRKDPDTVFAGAIFPPQRAERVTGGFKVSGRWPYCSGCMGASLIGAGISIEDEGKPSGLPRMAVMPRQSISIRHTWETVGLVATGSHDIVADGVVVPESWTFVRGSKPQLDHAIFRFPSMALAAQVLAVVGLGTAREALDWLHREALEKPSITGAPTIGARPYIQAELGKAEARLRSARAFFYETIDNSWQRVLAGDEIGHQERVMLRLAATQAAQEGAAVAQMAFFMGGSSAIQRGHVLARCMIDAASVAQHAFLGTGTWTSAGAGMLAQPTPAGYP
ncbi:acyl-CoA dehydrogenase [Mesorhizobium sp. L-8-10]|uniref:acyl-CoA dehydrogenase family protein n=1 Tax=Mesorhizobium sp. L-8-10 TaxID=2744523 RepID=UPI001928531F|nr:acyl-CoA dehydrogenase family protein [Mesorhizobium sp. L-8-10]BCH30508.1 acyl-CoA dehydrogenase [Mesorhizobium sp. L-8-10]